MHNEWSIKKEIINATQRFPIFMMYCLTGCLIGWITSIFLPSPYRATKELYVGLNTQRIIHHQQASNLIDIQIINMDDYKNWQMNSLNSVIFTDSIIEETLKQLQELDTYWKDFNTETLSDDLHVYWRNAGKWRLVAENKNARYARQAVYVWQEVVLEEINLAISASHQAYELDRQLQSTTNAQTKAIEQAAVYDQLIVDLINWKEILSLLSQNQLLSDSEHDILRSLTQYDTLTGSSATVINQKFPETNSPIYKYLYWIDEFLLWLNSENNIIQHRIKSLEIERLKYAADFEKASHSSMGLSSDLVVDGINGDQINVYTIRPTSLLILIGALLGMILWLSVLLIKICLRPE
jgi:hypothetical protein